MRKLIVIAFLIPVACGDGSAPLPKNRRPAAGSARSSRGRARHRRGKALVLKQKVDAAYRKEFTAADFQPDPTGEINRDPFRSYLVNPVVTPGTGVPLQDECADRKVAGKYSYTDLKLIGIIMRGSKNFAMFKDPTGFGQIAFQGDCLSKEKAKIIEITPGCVRIEIRGLAPPGAPAPPAHEEMQCLNKNEIRIE